MGKETKRALCMTLAASLFVLLACYWALISGNATVNCRGFAVDADGQTYTMRFKPGFYSIVNANGDTVYASTSLDKMVVLCLPLDIIGTIWFTMFCFMRSSRLRRELQGAAE